VLVIAASLFSGVAKGSANSLSTPYSLLAAVQRQLGGQWQ
jgi:hypothetical protein